MSNISASMYCSQVFDNYAVTVMIGEDPYTLGLFDTAGTNFDAVCDWIPSIKTSFVVI